MSRNGISRRQLRQAARKLVRAARQRGRGKWNELEEKFLALWSRLGGPLLEREYRFHPKRKWQADFVHVPSMLMVEIEGGIWVRGRHNSPRGFIADCDKYNMATVMGWRVLRLTREHLTEEYVRWIKETLFGEEKFR